MSHRTPSKATERNLAPSSRLSSAAISARIKANSARVHLSFSDRTWELQEKIAEAQLKLSTLRSKQRRLDLEVEAVVASTIYEATLKKASSASKQEAIDGARSAFDDRLASLSLQIKDAEKCRDEWTAALDNLKMEIEAAVALAEAKTLAEPSYRYSASDIPSAALQSERSSTPVAVHGGERDNASSPPESKPGKGSTLPEAEPKGNLGGDKDTFSSHHGSASPTNNATIPVATHGGERDNASSPPEPKPGKGSTLEEAEPETNIGSDKGTLSSHHGSASPMNNTTILVATHGGEKANACFPPEPKPGKGSAQQEVALPQIEPGGEEDTSGNPPMSQLDNATMPVAVHGGEGVNTSSPPEPEPRKGSTLQEVVPPPANSGADAETCTSHSPPTKNPAIIPVAADSRDTDNIGCLPETKPRKDPFLEVHPPQANLRDLINASSAKLFFRSAFASAPTDKISAQRSLCLLRLFLGSTWARMSRGP